MTLVVADKGESSEAARDIARTAARLFATRGYTATSVREIVEAAGYKKPTLYYHFGSKEGLAHALLHVPLTALAASLQETAASRDEPVDVLVRLFENHFAFCRAEPDRARFYYAICFGPLGADLAQELMKFIGPLEAPIADVIRRMGAAGIVDGARLDDFNWACRGLIKSAIMEFLYAGRELEPGLASRLVGDLLRGFGRSGSYGQG